MDTMHITQIAPMIKWNGLAKHNNLEQCWQCPHLEGVYENGRDRWIYPICDIDGGTIMCNVYSENCPRRIKTLFPSLPCGTGRGKDRKENEE